MVEIITRSEHSIHAIVKVHSSSTSFLFTAVYAPPQFYKRKSFWDYLQNLALNIALPWVLMGDFNDMTSDDEKLGGLPVNRSRIAAFRNCIDICGLIDLGFHGPRFTWTNKSPVWQTTIKERLDRGLGNAEWLMLFPSTQIHHLPRVKSDYCPILVDTNPFERYPSKPFRFEQMWLTDPTFSTLIQNSWRASALIPSGFSSLSFPRRLEALTENIRLWNKNHFGNLFQRKTHLLARLRGIQVALAKTFSVFLHTLEQQLTQDYNTVLHQEFLFWRLKSRIMWLNNGDANTKFFHLKTLQRRSHSRVVTLKDEAGLWLTDDPLTQHIYNAFKKLFRATSQNVWPPSRTDTQLCPNSPFYYHAQELVKIPQPEEILKSSRSSLH